MVVWSDFASDMRHEWMDHLSGLGWMNDIPKHEAMASLPFACKFDTQIYIS